MKMKLLKWKKKKLKERWKSYFSSLLNKTNEYQLAEEDKVERVGVHQGSEPSLLILWVVVMQEAATAARGEGLWDLLYTNDLVITAKSEKEAVRKFGAWKREI